MIDMTVTQKIKTGFWLGIGFIIPLVLSSLVGLAASVISTPFIMEKTFNKTESRIEINKEYSRPKLVDKEDLIKQIEIIEHHESRRGNRLLILGVVKNKGPENISSINLQAEFFDKEGKFILECDEYISRRLKSMETENFQMRCGCSDEPLPEYESLNIRIMSASNY